MKDIRAEILAGVLLLATLVLTACIIMINGSSPAWWNKLVTGLALLLVGGALAIATPKVPPSL